MAIVILDNPRDTVRREWTRYQQATIVDAVHGRQRNVEMAAFAAGASSMFKLAFIRIAAQPTAEKQEAEKQAIAEELAALVFEANGGRV